MKPAVIRALTALTLGVALSHGSCPGIGQSPTSGAPPSRNVLVELFTSEGCSSCPAADTLLQQLNGHRLPSGELVIGLSEHVTYWNHLGWSDPFSSDRFTERQSAYSDHFGSGSVYTPQVVINGSREAVGSDRAAVLLAIHAAAAETSASDLKIQIRSAVATGKGILVTYDVRSGSVPSSAAIYAAVADDWRQSRVARGENTGRTLAHVAVARSISFLSPLHTGDAITARIPPPTGDAVSRHLVLFAQARDTGRVFAIDTRPIEGPSHINTASAQAPNSLVAH